MYAALFRSVCALPLNLIWGFETTSRHRPRRTGLRQSSATIGKKNTSEAAREQSAHYGFGYVCVDSYGWPGWVQLLYGKFLRLSKQGCALNVLVLGSTYGQLATL